MIEYDLGERLKETFGIVVSGIDIGAIEIDKTSEGYRQLMSVTRDLSAATVKVETWLLVVLLDKISLVL